MLATRSDDMPTYDVQKARLPTETDEFVRIPKRRVIVSETLALALTTLLLGVNTSFAVYSWWGDALGIGERTREGLTTLKFRTPFSPAPWTFGAWLAVFIMQYVWLIHAWTYVCRQKTQRASSPALYPCFWIVNCINIGYVYAVGHLANELSLALIAAEAVILCVSIAIVAVSLYQNVNGLMEISTGDKWSTRLLTLNGLALYATWAIISTLFHTASVLNEDTDLHNDTITTCLLSLIAALTISYFLMQATNIDRYIRYVITVYPIVMWWLGGMLSEQWDEEFDGISRNNLFTFVLLIVVGVLLVVHLVLIIVFSCTRPLVGGGGRDDIDGIALIPY